jgi:hypothetical protein
MAAACDEDQCGQPPAAKDLAGREQQPRGPLPEAQLPVALPLPTAGRAAALTTSPASPQPSTHAIARTQRRPTSRTRAGRNKHEDVGAAVAQAGRAQPNETPPAHLRGFKTLQVWQLPPRTERLCMPNYSSTDPLNRPTQGRARLCSNCGGGAREDQPALDPRLFLAPGPD